LVQIFSSTPCSQTPSVCVPPLMLEIKFYGRKPQLENLCIDGAKCQLKFSRSKSDN
jgi:hypothetical protein